MRRRWPWNVVQEFKCSSLSNGFVQVEPVWQPGEVGSEGQPPGVMTRMAVASWMETKLNGGKRKGSQAVVSEYNEKGINDEYSIKGISSKLSDARTDYK